jgi:CBS domain-containing protein
MPLLYVHRLFVQEEIHGAPVVDDDGTLRGVISSSDLLRAVEEEYLGHSSLSAPTYFREELPYSGPDWLHSVEDFQDRLSSLTASDVLTTEIIAVGLHTHVSEIAGVMRAQRIHRVFVIDQNELRGIITSLDLLQLLESPASNSRIAQWTHEH